MKKTYIAPGLETFELPSAILMSATSTLGQGENGTSGGGISNAESKGWGGGLFDDEE